MLYLLIAASALLAAPENLLHDPAFADGLSQWRTVAGSARAELTDVDGARALSIHAETVDGFPRVVQEFDATPGALYSAEALVRGDNTAGGYGAYMTIEFLGADGHRIHFEQSSPAGPAWMRLVARSVAPEGTARGLFCLVLNGTGTGLYRAPKVQLTEPAPPAAVPEEMHLAFGKPLKPPFFGFGFEDDGWLTNEENAGKGVTGEDIERVHSRIEWMAPATVRMFFWYKDFNPSGDWATFDFDADNMRSHYRALDVYQKIGASVNVTGVEWSIKDPWARPEAMAHAIGEFFSELITKRGYTCIKRWTLTNEPNTHFLREGATFETYRQLHLLVAKEFAARGLQIEIIGSDDTNGGLPWFSQCVEDSEYFAAAGTMASHFYLQRGSLRAGKYNIIDRLDLLAGRKPLTIEEFGFQDARSGAIVNPLMDEFDYALLASAFAMDAVARGVSGLNIWCLHDVQYPVGFMTYGLFRYKDKGWTPKPVFYAWANLTRNTRPGAPVQAVTTPLPPSISAVRIGASVFVVNQAATPVRFVVDDAQLSEARILDEGSVPADGADETAIRAAAEGRPVPVESNGFSVPPRAIGRAW